MKIQCKAHFGSCLQ